MDDARLPEHSRLLQDISALIAERPRGARERVLARIENTLTAGYARALELEAERWRLERRIASVAQDLASGRGGGDRQGEIASLARCRARADGDLSVLRGLLSSLRERANELRAA